MDHGIVVRAWLAS